MSESLQDISHDLVAVRRAKLAELRAGGFDPFRANCKQTHFATDAVVAYQDGKDYAVSVAVAGRLVTFRDMGKSCFAKLQDQTGLIQIYVKLDVVGEDTYKAFKKIDLGDILGVEGELFKTRTGEVTVRVARFTLVSKSLRPLPEKWHGLADAEQIYRQRYLDLIVNAESRKRFFQRSRIVSGIRRYLEDRAFLEVETPVLQNVPGGAAARPFTTHHTALGCEFFLRISLELYLKRCLVGGYDRVFEIGRNFRNEGISRRHNPEFTMLEVYQAYSDYRGMMELIRGMVLHLCDTVIGSRVVTQYNGVEIDFGGEWREVRYKDVVREATGDPEWFSRTKEQKLAAMPGLGLFAEASWEDHEITNEVFSKLVEPKLIQPTFVTHLPKELVPLAKRSLEEPDTVEVFELCIGGMEIAPAYSEQNDPDIQREAFEQQAGEEVQKVDQDFLAALEHGMPPAGGMGVGIDRLVALLTGGESLRDVILFPSLRPGGA
jgi:lysyl-tRNA synthetase class 2